LRLFEKKSFSREDMKTVMPGKGARTEGSMPNEAVFSKDNKGHGYCFIKR
jgi:hypothetical protein